jgi:hypothetical protein
MLVAKAPMKMVVRKTPLLRIRVLFARLVFVSQCWCAGRGRILVETAENARHLAGNLDGVLLEERGSGSGGSKEVCEHNRGLRS